MPDPEEVQDCQYTVSVGDTVVINPEFTGPNLPPERKVVKQILVSVEPRWKELNMSKARVHWLFTDGTTAGHHDNVQKVQP